nr:hypothetical protein [Tanacetum cinerariifolium]
MDTIIEQQAAMDEALVPNAQRDMIHICPRVHGQYFDEPPFEEEILAFIHFLGHRAAPPKPKASVRRTRSSSDTSITPPTAAASPRLTAFAKVTKRSIQQMHISQASSFGADEGTGSIPGVPNAPTDESEEELSWNFTNDEGADNEGKDGDDDEEDEGDDGEEGDGDDDEEEGNSDEDLGLNVGGEEGHVEEEEEDELYRDVNINQGMGLQMTLEVEDSHMTLTPVNLDGMESIFETTSQTDVQTPTSVASLPITAPTMTPSTIATITTTSQAPILPTTVPSNIIQNLPNFGSLFRFDDRLRTLETNFSEFTQTNKFVGASDRLCDEAQRENDEFLKTVDENMQKIIKEQVKEQVKVQVSKILSRIEHTMNEQLEAKVLTRSSHSSKTSYDVAADLSEIELKNILIKKIEGNKSAGRSTQGSRSRQASASESALAEEPMQTTSQMEEPSRLKFYTDKRTREAIESRSSFNELMDTPLDFSNFLINRLKVDTLTPELLAGPTYELMKGSCKSLVELEYHLEEVFKATIDQLDCVNPEGQQYTHNLLKPLPLIPNNRGRRVISFEHFINNDLEYLRGGASSRKYTTSIMKTKVADYGHIKDDDKLYKFKEGDFKRLRTQNIEDMLLLLVQGKLTNLTVEERFAFNVSLRMFTRNIVIQKRVEDLQLGVKSYQKKLNLTKPDLYRSDLKRKEAYTAYSNPQGFIYQNKDKRNRLMRIDELHKFSDGTLTDVRTALDDCLKGIQMQYLPQSIWRKVTKTEQRP